MQIDKNMEGNTLVITLSGRLDTITSPALEAEVKGSASGADALVIDMKRVEYVSSAGLRVILSAHKAMAGRGGMKLQNVTPGVMEILEVTGFAGVLRVEEAKG